MLARQLAVHVAPQERASLQVATDRLSTALGPDEEVLRLSPGWHVGLPGLVVTSSRVLWMPAAAGEPVSIDAPAIASSRCLGPQGTDIEVTTAAGVTHRFDRLGPGQWAGDCAVVIAALARGDGSEAANTAATYDSDLRRTRLARGAEAEPLRPGPNAVPGVGDPGSAFTPLATPATAYAGFGARAVGYITDGIAVGGVFFVFAILGSIAPVEVIGSMLFLAAIGATFLVYGYFTWMVAVDGQSPGMRLAGVRAVDERGWPLGADRGGGPRRAHGW